MAGASLRIGYETRIGPQRWAGSVIATPAGLYCALVVANGVGDLMAGTAVAAWRASKFLGGPRIGTVADAPPELLADRTGPLRRLQSSLPMLIVPKQAVARIDKRSLINNTLEFTLDDQKVVISHLVFAPGKVREYLAQTGWPLRWRGTEFNLTPNPAPKTRQPKTPALK